MYRTIADVKRANAAAGYHFFEPATMESFASRIETPLIRGRFFVTSEQYEPSEEGQRLHGLEAGPRLYTVREALPNGRVETVGTFQGFPDLYSAKQEILDLIATPVR